MEGRSGGREVVEGGSGGREWREGVMGGSGGAQAHVCGLDLVQVLTCLG